MGACYQLDTHLNLAGQASLNARINIFYALDSLIESSVNAGTPIYLNLLKRDLPRIVDLVVPHSREGILNLMSTRQVRISCESSTRLALILEHWTGPTELEDEKNSRARHYRADRKQARAAC